jgi:twitching motility protein PilT
MVGSSTNNPKAVAVLSRIIILAEKLGASDIHMRSGGPVMVRVDGSIIEMAGSPPAFEEGQLISMMKGVLPSTRMGEFLETNQVDAAFGATDGPRVRINMYRQLGRTAVVMRIINAEIMSVQQLQLPPQLSVVPKLRRGLVIFSGATGSGKSTSMAAILNEINHTRSEHILTIEDPIEYQFKEDKCIISQREVGTDVQNFNHAIRAALREDPDIILMGEMRDYESIEFALELAETGHLVFSTLHAPTAVESVSRMVSSFPPAGQSAMRNKLAQNLQMVVAQRLVKRDPEGRIAACEVMTVNELVSEMIMDPDKTHEIEELLKGEDAIEGMLHFDEHLRLLVEAGTITVDVALENASSQTDLELKLQGF